MSARADGIPHSDPEIRQMLAKDISKLNPNDRLYLAGIAKGLAVSAARHADLADKTANNN